MKAYGALEAYSKYVDKYEVRSYVEERVGDEYLIPLLGVWKRYEDIPFSDFPNEFVLQATHGSNYVFICKDKSVIDYGSLESLVHTWMRENFYSVTREPQYRYCLPKIMCTRYLDDGSGDLKDYKFFCSNGFPRVVQIDSDRFSGHKRDFMSSEWSRLPISVMYPNSDIVVQSPDNLPEMMKIAEILSKNFSFVRVDLYSVRGRTYFGELTFTPGNGVEIFKPDSADYEFGELIDIVKYA